MSEEGPVYTIGGQPVTVKQLENLERRATALLYAIWQIQHKERRIVQLPAPGHTKEPGHEIANTPAVGLPAQQVVKKDVEHKGQEHG